MTKSGHFKTGIGIAITGASITYAVSHVAAQAVVVVLVAIAGSSLPDNLEIKWWARGKRSSLIPHRTITHWLTAWVVATAYLLYGLHTGNTVFQIPLLTAALLGLCVGGLGHSLMDSMTPMGVPILNPFSRGSLRILTSGSAMENIAALVTLGVGVLAAYQVFFLGFSFF